MAALGDRLTLRAMVSSRGLKTAVFVCRLIESSLTHRINRSNDPTLDPVKPKLGLGPP